MSYALWFFEGTTYTPVFDFADGKTAAQVKAEVLAAALGGMTPMAHSVCAAIDELINYLPSEFHTKRIYMATDGEENNSPVGEDESVVQMFLIDPLTQHRIQNFDVPRHRRRHEAVVVWRDDLCPRFKEQLDHVTLNFESCRGESWKPFNAGFKIGGSIDFDSRSQEKLDRDGVAI